MKPLPDRIDGYDAVRTFAGALPPPALVALAATRVAPHARGRDKLLAVTSTRPLSPAAWPMTPRWPSTITCATANIGVAMRTARIDGGCDLVVPGARATGRILKSGRHAADHGLVGRPGIPRGVARRTGYAGGDDHQRRPRMRVDWSRVRGGFS